MTHSAETFRRESFTVALLTGTEKIGRRGGGVSRFYVENLLSHSAEKFDSCGNPLLLNYFRVPKKIGEEGGVSRFYVEKFLTHSVATFRRGIFTAAFFFPIAKKFMDKKGGSVKIFRRKLFISQCRRVWQGNPLVYTKFGNRKFFLLERVISRFSVENFCLLVPKLLAGEHFGAVFQNCSGSEKIFG